MNFLIFPNQLFDLQYLPKEIKTIYLIEHPIFFGKRGSLQMNFNQLKLLLHCSSMKFYKDELEKGGYKVSYLSYHEFSYQKLPKTLVECFDVVDHLLEKELKKNIKGIKFHENPNFLVSTEELDEFYKKKNGKILHKNFYEFIKKKINILKGEKTFDNENRHKIPKGVKIPPLPKEGNESKKYIEKSKKYIEKYFKKNYGNLDLKFPVTRKESEIWFQNFLEKKLDKFGTYQDAIVEGENFLFHSIISPMLNIGLLDPKNIIEKTLTYSTKKNISKNNYEGFLRQVVGWREYQRFTYIYYYNDIIGKNIFKNERKLNKKWYDGTLGIKPVDDAIKLAFQDGYLHHILRLMIMGNFMNLCRIHPKEAYKWFMEFSVDSYDWVMIQNVYGMAMWSDGGFTMRKPYISTENYILNMSNYQCSEKWCPIWKSLYYNFLEEFQDILKKTPYGRNLVLWNKKTKKEKSMIQKEGKNFLKEL